MDNSNLKKRFYNASRIYRSLCEAKPTDMHQEQILEFFSTRQHRINMCFERIQDEFQSLDKNSEERLSKLIFNVEEQLRDFLPVVMDKEQIEYYVKERNLPEGFKR